ncbi:hypothetical protein [Photorhabdus heterorhabditis]|uniref:hypothetical protein n=1 Tax=Photorhabdus heterorhabditis TaxID=880156 RepID=UPI001BD43550|nr:hypothetical protein [Photorhabdus heterorhabditis]MBS9442456.1 hypothetical protein [Photorhabdus heterorhabditis]
MSENKKHVHAELMMQYAQDALKTDRPYELWEMFCSDSDWRTLTNHPRWQVDYLYRRKPEMITVGTVSFPKPVDYWLKEWDRYFTATFDGLEYFVWRNNNSDYYRLQSGIIHLTKEAAKQHSEALVKINKGEF